MQQLWAPWRMTYVVSEPEPGCVLCNAWAGEHDDRTLLVHREADAFVLMNRFPYNGGHVMVIPRRHVGNPADLPAAEWAALFDLVRRTTLVVSRALKTHGLNVGMNLGRTAGAGIDEHLHVHVVPRWNGDTNFMPVLADTKVVSEALEATWARLRNAFREEAAR
jgi:ATP adenylyltransferase